MIIVSEVVVFRGSSLIPRHQTAAGKSWGKSGERLEPIKPDDEADRLCVKTMPDSVTFTTKTQSSISAKGGRGPGLWMVTLSLALLRRPPAKSRRPDPPKPTAFLRGLPLTDLDHKTLPSCSPGANACSCTYQSLRSSTHNLLFAKRLTEILS